jgi:hypothetical protein
MDGASLMRLRWRLHGAWMWPTFIVMTVLDGLLVHWRPIVGQTESAIAGWLLATFGSLAGIALLSPVLGFLLRRLRPDMPKVVARDYAGTGVVVAVSAALIGAGLVHHRTVTVDARALEDAVARAEAFIGDRAPPEFRANLQSENTLEIQPPRLYRTCVTNADRSKTYCVVVDRSKPFGHSVLPAGSEPNQVLGQGTG